LDVEVGDYVSFLYGAHILNLYEVADKIAYRNAKNLPPWPPIHFRESGREYYFPFRLKLRRIRSLNESLIRPEFNYVAQNLLLRGGYRKSHFQSDSVSLSVVSQMGTFSPEDPKVGDFGGDMFQPKITFVNAKVREPEVYLFKENILQTLVKKKLHEIIGDILDRLGSHDDPREYEFLSERALMEGHVDIFAKLRNPIGRIGAIPVEVKKGRVSRGHVRQIEKYLEELEEDAIGGVLVGKDFPDTLRSHRKIIFISYSFAGLDPAEDPYDYDDLLESLHLEILR